MQQRNPGHTYSSQVSKLEKMDLDYGEDLSSFQNILEGVMILIFNLPSRKDHCRFHQMCNFLELLGHLHQLQVTEGGELSWNKDELVAIQIAARIVKICVRYYNWTAKRAEFKISVCKMYNMKVYHLVFLLLCRWLINITKQRIDNCGPFCNHRFTICGW